MTWGTALSDYLLVAPHVLLCGVLVLLCRQRRYRRFPLFFAYILSEIVQFVVLLAILRIPSLSGQVYGVAYAIGAGASTALRFGVIHEIFSDVFRNYRAVASLGRPILRWTTVALLSLGLLLAANTGSGGYDRVFAILLRLDRTASIMQCGLLVLLFCFAKYLRLSLRSSVFGISLGLGVFATIELAAAALRPSLQYWGQLFLNDLTMATYHACVVIWLVYLWAPERSTQYAVKTVPEHDLEAWNKELQRLIQQ